MKHRAILDKIRIRFKANKQRSEYWNDELHLKDMETILVHPGLAKRLIHYFPDNFEKVKVRYWKIGKRLRKPLKLSEISLVSIVNRPEVFEKNLKPSIPRGIEKIIIDNQDNKQFPSASKALNWGIKKANNSIVLCVHQDIKFHRDWFDAFIKQECRLKGWGILGGVGIIGQEYRLIWGYSLDRAMQATSLDECLMVINKKNNIGFDEKVFDGWHLYSADFCMQCREKELKICILAGEFVHRWQENPKSDWLKSTIPYRGKFSRKWQVPVTTTIGTIGER